MSFANTQRNESNPTYFRPRITNFPTVRKSRLRNIGIGTLVLLGLLYFFSQKPREQQPKALRDQEHLAAPIIEEPRTNGTPPVVVVTVFDDGHDEEAYSAVIRGNRMQYTKKHGYGTFFPSSTDYNLRGAPTSWSKVTAMRHAMAKFPDCTYIWFLDQDSLIMDMNVVIERDLMDVDRLGRMMIPNVPIVPPDSIIKTDPQLEPADVNLVVTQDKLGLSVSSIIVRNGEWARFFLDTWLDPSYRAYNFQRAEIHALEHIVQWHPTILSRLALLPQNKINSYHRADAGVAYSDGDFVVHLERCSRTGPHNCSAQADELLSRKHVAL